MQTVLHTANSRGKASHGGWLSSAHSFSFAEYYDAERMGFGALRVLNDDQVAGGGGFPPHSHKNMEIVSIPLVGDLEHKDNMKNAEVIRQGDVQIMSAGTGVIHSEFNHSTSDPVHFLQIWITPEHQNVAPRYAQRAFSPHQRINQWQTVIAPINEVASTEGEALGIYQQSYLSLTQLEAGKSLDYNLYSDSSKKNQGVYFFVLSGEITIAKHHLKTRDAIGVWDSTNIELNAEKTTTVLAIEVPL